MSSALPHPWDFPVQGSGSKISNCIKLFRIEVADLIVLTDDR
ncbi:hypothetical protein [Amazonocrinis nigriterrae]|nr:hypothetical protein [Amazonocrinis nigriterrae]